MYLYRKLLIFKAVIVIASLLTSCEYDPDGLNYREVEVLPDEIKVGINLANANPNDTIFIYGPTTLYYQIAPETGTVKTISFTFNGNTIKLEDSQGYYTVAPNETDAYKPQTLQLDVLIKANNGSLANAVTGYTYVTKAAYNVKYIHITAEDFAVKKFEVDKVTLNMVNKNSYPCRYVINGKLVTDLDNIEIPRNDFPYGNNLVQIYLLPSGAAVSDYQKYNYVEFRYWDNKLPEIPGGMSVSFYKDHNNLFAIYSDKIYVYDKNLNLVNQKTMNVQNIAITPETGLVACYAYGKITTYSDKTLSQVVSTIDNGFGRFVVTSKNQLFKINNFQVDVFDLTTGKPVYSIGVSSSLWNIAVSEDGQYLCVKTSDTFFVYQLTDNSASLLFTLNDNLTDCCFHPINKHHLILKGSEGFKVYDMETRQIVFSDKGELQSVDPVTGNMLYYDKDYGYNGTIQNYKNHFIDKSYNEVYVMDNSTKSLYGPFTLFNNYLIKSTAFVDVSSKLQK